VRAMLSYDYAILRVVPSVEREEFVNAGVVLHCPERAFLECRVHVDERRLRALWPALDLDRSGSIWKPSPKSAPAIPTRDPSPGSRAAERFQWLVAPRSTIIQVSPVHSGVCDRRRRRSTKSSGGWS
jgi:hypothetical protein